MENLLTSSQLGSIHVHWHLLITHISYYGSYFGQVLYSEKRIFTLRTFVVQSYTASVKLTFIEDFFFQSKVLAHVLLGINISCDLISIVDTFTAVDEFSLDIALSFPLCTVYLKWAYIISWFNKFWRKDHTFSPTELKLLFHNVQWHTWCIGIGTLLLLICYHDSQDALPSAVALR